jgi:hypothetical protein
MTVATLNSRTLNNVVVAVTSDNADVNRPHRYNQIEIMVMPSATDVSVAPRPGPDQPLTVPPTWVNLAAWTAAREAADTTIDTAAVSWAR